MSDDLRELEVIPTGRALGAEVRGINLADPIPAERARELRAIWRDHLVLLFRGQDLDEEQLLDTADAFGGRQVAGSRAYLIKAGHKPGEGARLSRHAAISVVSNLGEDGKPVQITDAVGSLSLKWHSDNSYVETPPRGSLLHARVVPVNGGGETSFNNQYLAYERLSDELKRRIEGLHVCHDNTRNTAGRLRPTVAPPRSRGDIKGPHHPIVRMHPDTRRCALYLGRHYEWPSSYVVELNDDDSETLLAELWQYATAEELAWTHEWAAGDLLLWDNRCTMHARATIDHTQARVMHRALIKGEPVTAPWDNGAGRQLSPETA